MHSARFSFVMLGLMLLGLDQRLPKGFAYVRPCLLKGGHFFLPSMANGGIHKFEPVDSKGQEKQLTGTVSYRERMALPSDAVLEVTIEDVSRADAPARAIAHTTVEQPGTPPVRFTIPYDPSLIDATHRYSLRTRILVKGKLLFINDQSQPVLTQGASDKISVVLRRVSSAPSASVSLEGAQWKLTSFNGSDALLGSGSKVPNLTLDPITHRVSGWSGCNRLTGTYNLALEQLTFSQMAGTRMACASGMELERQFLDSMQRVKRWRIDAGTLSLFDLAGNLIASFEVSHDK